MKATNDDRNISVEFTEEEALVFLDWLSRLNSEDRAELFEDQAEQRVLWDLEAVLEQVITVVVSPDYSSQLAKAREHLRDKE